MNQFQDDYLFEGCPKNSSPRHLNVSLLERLHPHIEKVGVTFSTIGALMIALPASVLNTFLTNLCFLIGDLFLLALFRSEKKRRKWLIYQYYVFITIAFSGTVINFPGFSIFGI